MDNSWSKIQSKEKDIARDRREVFDLGTRALIDLKLGLYSFSRPFANREIRSALHSRAASDPLWPEVDVFLKGEGGLFKKYVYGKCDALRPLKNARVLVAGAGYGRNMYQLGEFRPKKIVAFDPIDFKEDWKSLIPQLKDAFDIDTEFFAGDFNALPQEYVGSFDFVVSDAVLMHVRDMRAFAEASARFLKPGGIFYASFGPTWFGPQGDMLPWQGLYYQQLILSPEEYRVKAGKIAEAQGEVNLRYKGYFETFVREMPFTKISGYDYVRLLREAGFEKELLYVQIDTASISWLDAHPDVARKLDELKVPPLDRYAKGFALWMRKSPKD
jgi:SAM-dependent methyltransferase